LTERDYGKFEGTQLEALKSLRNGLGHKYLDVTLDWEKGQGVESPSDVFERIRVFISSIKNVDNVALITHAGVIFSVLDSVFNFGINCSATIKITNGGFVRIEKMTLLTLHE
jgi:broad specificity phosphatase PhoE